MRQEKYYQINIERQIRRNYKVFEHEEGVLEGKSYHKQETRQRVKKTKFFIHCFQCKFLHWLDFIKSYCCTKCEHTTVEKKRQLNRKVLTQDRNFSTRPPYERKKLRENYFFMLKKV